jgi:hypothetical protein
MGANACKGQSACKGGKSRGPGGERLQGAGFRLDEQDGLRRGQGQVQAGLIPTRVSRHPSRYIFLSWPQFPRTGAISFGRPAEFRDPDFSQLSPTIQSESAVRRRR